MPGEQGLENDARFQRQETMNTLLEVSKEQSNLPPESIAFIAPKNNSIKPLERLEAPPDMLELEANFVRNACRALGIPTSIHEGSRQACYRLLFSHIAFYFRILLLCEGLLRFFHMRQTQAGLQQVGVERRP